MAAAAPMLMASAKRQAGQRGPSKWQSGSKLWESMVFHKEQSLLSKYPGKTNHDSTTGANDSAFQCIRKPELPQPNSQPDYVFRTDQP
jgi:hypothetical protein